MIASRSHDERRGGARPGPSGAARRTIAPAKTRGAPRPAIHAGGVLAIQLPLALVLAVADADTVFLEFEELHGPCGEFDLVAGPGSVEVDAVRVVSSHHVTWSLGSEASVPAGLGNPFESDALLLFTHGAGATIVFPEPVARVFFMTGMHSSIPAPPWFELLAEGRLLTTFTASSAALGVVDVRLSPPIDAVTIRFAGGWSPLLGIDSLGYVSGGSCVADLDGDGTVDGSDLGVLLATWGRGGAADLNHDGVVDGVDIGLLLGSWSEPGECGTERL